MPQVSDLTALTALTDDDLLLAIDAPGSTHLAKKITALNAKTYFTAGIGGGSSTYVSGLTAGDVGTYASANLTALQAALDAAEAAGGGRVIIPAGIYQINGTANIGTRVILAGVGWGSRLKLADSVSTTVAPKPVLAAKGNSNYIGVEDLYIDGNKANQADTGYASNGIDFYARGSSEGFGPPIYDGGLWCSRVMVYGCKGVGFYVRGDTTTMRVTDCYSYHNDSDGFWFKTDCEIANCVAGNNGGKGFHCYSGTSVRMTSLKSFGNGVRLGSPDFHVEYCNTVMMSDCQSEDSHQWGFVITAVNHFTGMGLQAYRCGQALDSNSSAFWIEDDGAGNLIHDFKLIGSALCSGGGDTFNWALTTRNLGAHVDIQLNATGYATGRWQSLSGSADAKVRFGNEDGGNQAIAYAATITPDQYLGNRIMVGALTGNITVNNPADARTGQMLHVRFLQDATGSRTVTWGSNFVLNGWAPQSAANARSAISFVYDGSKWVAEAW